MKHPINPLDKLAFICVAWFVLYIIVAGSIGGLT